MTDFKNAAQVLERLPDPVLVIEPGAGASDRRIAYANPAARALLRISGGDTPLIAVLRHPQVLEAVEDGLAGREADAVHETNGAQPRWQRVQVRPLPPAAHADAFRALIVLRDETEARRNERMRADFLANASHELRTPLASLSGFIETLRGHAKDDPEARERFLGIMAGQAGRMARLIGDLLSLSRIELNEHVPPNGSADLPAVVQEVLSAGAPIWASRAEVKSAGLDQAHSVLIADRDQLVQVVQNLVDNAVKYTPDGGEVTVTLSQAGDFDPARTPVRPGAPRLSLLEPAAGAAGYLVLQVADQGPGIARQNLHRLSERFYRVEGQKSGAKLGTGLGLAIVKHIVNRHRGGLVVESLEGEGTTFSVYLPLA